MRPTKQQRAADPQKQRPEAQQKYEGVEVWGGRAWRIMAKGMPCNAVDAHAATTPPAAAAAVAAAAVAAAAALIVAIAIAAAANATAERLSRAAKSSKRAHSAERLPGDTRVAVQDAVVGQVAQRRCRHEREGLCDQQALAECEGVGQLRHQGVVSRGRRRQQRHRRSS